MSSDLSRRPNEDPRDSVPQTRLGWWSKWVVVPILLTGLVLWLTRLFRVNTSETFDESIYLWLGFSIFNRGNFTNLASPMCPPLPILLEYAWPGLTSRILPETAGWDQHVPTLIHQARLATSILIGVPLVLVVSGWLTRRRGWVVGAIGGGLAALSPTILAASSVATTDACFALFGLVALGAIRCYQVDPSRRSFLVMGGALGVALASKQTAVILVPLACLEVFLKSPPKPPGDTRVDHALRIMLRMVSRLVGLVLLMFVVDWALYGFGLAPKFGDASTHTPIPVILPMVASFLPDGEAFLDFVRQWRPPLPIDTFLGQMDHASRGHCAFLMEQWSFTGWWYFFPVALAIKSTPAELVLFGLAIYQACRPSTWSEPTRRLWLGAMLLLIAAGMASSINIGQRYMLLCYPLVILIGFDWMAESRRAGFARRLPVLVGGAHFTGKWFVTSSLSGLLVWQAISLGGIAPHYLGYFNSFCGGPLAGHRYLVDSSLDWGQDLPSLRRELEARGYRRVALSYFGLAKPSVYGIRSTDWLPTNEAEARECDWMAISATHRQGVYGIPVSTHRLLIDLPTIRVGYSIFLYDLKDPRIRKFWEEIQASIRPTNRNSYQ